MSHRINERTLALAKGIAEHRGTGRARRAAIQLSADDVEAICAALSDVWEVASTGEALAAQVLARNDDLHEESLPLSMVVHADNIITEMKALAGPNEQEIAR